MQTRTESQGWDSRFTDGDGMLPVESATSQLKRNFEQESLLQDVLTTVRNELPHIEPHYLVFHSCLGQGSSFEVNKELFHPSGEPAHYVAVKRILMRHGSDDSIKSDEDLQAESRRLANILREVRILTHPKLRSHSCLVSAIGWGGMPDPRSENRLYLVMRYSDHGTLSRFAQKQNINLIERRFLTLDAAMGLRALHESNIVHGDVKPENVLIYGSTRVQDHDRHFLAKLADFGCAIFEQDLSRQELYYLGTPKYNAPEICGRFKCDSEEAQQEISKFEQFKTADCYSFGLLLWETVNNGKSFVEYGWLKPGESAVDFLERAFYSKENAVLDLATKCFRRLQTNSSTINDREMKPLADLYPSNPTRLQLTEFLKRWPHLSEQLDNIGAPSDTKSANVPLEGSSTLKILPQKLVENGSSPWAGLQDEILMRHNGTQSADITTLLLNKRSWSSHTTLRPISLSTPADPSQQLVKIPASKQSETITVTPQTYRYGSEDMFKNAINRQPPWYSQCEAANFFQRAVDIEQDPERKAQARLQLALMYQIGYGLAQDSSKALYHLEAASKNNKVALAIFRQSRKASSPDEQEREHAAASQEQHVTYKDPAILYDGLLWRSERDDSNPTDRFLDLGQISVPSISILAILVKRGRYEPHILSEALTAACRDGHLDAAMLFAEHCTDFSAINTRLPNPLHWLIMFSPREATSLLHTLVSGSDMSDNDRRLKAVRSLMASDHEGTTILLPHRCMELRGTPLHWAVIAGYTNLVAAFIRIGADVNVRNVWKINDSGDGRREHYPSLSPLDLAVACHFPQIVALLINHGGETYGGDWYWSHSPFHMVGYDTFPFGRHVAHGQGHRAALQETIRILINRGLDINALDSLGQTPLFVAVKNLDLEPYILEELLLAGAGVEAECEKQDGNVVVTAVVRCYYRRLSWQKLPLLLPHVRDINAKSESGLNALHHCALFDAVPAVDVLLQAPGIDVDAESAQGDTAVSLAAKRGSLGVLASLIRKGADLHRGFSLAGAISAGQIDALSMLVDAGAGIHFRTNQKPRGVKLSVLHYATSRYSRRPSHIRACLDKLPRLRAQEALDDRIDGIWTPLHDATYYGDVDGVRALLEAGADPLKTYVDLSGPKTPLELATKTLKRVDPDLANLSHPRLEAERNDLPQSREYLAQLRRTEVRFKDCLSEIIDMLQRAEIERRLEGLGCPSETAATTN
ncbi:hypothetical protein F4819DRAFT_488563 [Hypoxylon fuscum]|nr:hypothetical protein F4819DRAFT_488563 [Hypoxylon fuscum]